MSMHILLTESEQYEYVAMREMLQALVREHITVGASQGYEFQYILQRCHYLYNFGRDRLRLMQMKEALEQKLRHT